MAAAALSVIYDNGATEPIAPFLDVFESPDEPPPQRPTRPKPHLGAADFNALLPVRSPGLTPGPVQARAHALPFTRPFFLIGADALSRQWLHDHRVRLQQMGAVGMLVQADTLEDLRAIARLSEGLSILPASASDIAKALRISHYPVLVSPQGIEQ
jgi:integrating conjugative element protein (TIGR03765 family)